MIGWQKNIVKASVIVSGFFDCGILMILQKYYLKGHFSTNEKIFFESQYKDYFKNVYVCYPLMESFELRQYPFSHVVKSTSKLSELPPPLNKCI